MTITVTNIILTGATIYYAPVAEADPADSVAYGTAWGGNWVEIGATGSELTIAYDRTRQDIFIQQALGPVDRRVTQETMMLETTLREITSTNLALAMDGTASTTAAGAGQVGKDELVAGGETILDQRKWGVEGMYWDATNEVKRPARIFIHKATSVINGNLAFNKEEETGIPLAIEALEDLSQTLGERFFKFQRVTAPATS